MPTRSWVSPVGWAMLALAACAGARPLRMTAQDAPSGMLNVDLAGRSMPVKVALVATEVDPRDHAATPLGVRDGFLLLSDSYASRGQPLSRCQAGRETWVRLIDIHARAERWSKRVESCLHDIQAGDPVAAWANSGTGFSVNMLSEPSVHLFVHADGRVVVRD